MIRISGAVLDPTTKYQLDSNTALIIPVSSIQPFKNDLQNGKGNQESVKASPEDNFHDVLTKVLMNKNR